MPTAFLRRRKQAKQAAERDAYLFTFEIDSRFRTRKSGGMKVTDLMSEAEHSEFVAMWLRWQAQKARKGK